VDLIVADPAVAIRHSILNQCNVFAAARALSCSPKFQTVEVSLLKSCVATRFAQVSIMLHLDDPLDAIAVHAWNGTWGLIAPGLFAAESLIQVCRRVR